MTPGRRRLVLADPLSEEGLRVLRACEELEVVDLSGADRETLRRGLAGAAGLIVRSGTLADEELLEAADCLEVIGRAGVGLDNIDVEAATRRGIAVLNAPEGNTRSTAELAFGLLLAAVRRIPEAERSLREGRWERRRFRGMQLAGRTLGVVGAGRIGTRMIRFGRSFGMRVVVHDPYLATGRAADLGAEPLTLDALLAEADVVTLHVPLTDETRGLIGAAELARMKPGAVLVNAARGGILDETALAAALRDGRLSGAALDVFEEEPLPAEHPLRDAPGLVMTPHLGAATSEAQREVAIEIATAVRDALLEGDLQSAVNAPRLDPAEAGRWRPLLGLTRRLGLLLAELTEGRAERIELRYAGGLDGALRPLAAAAMEGYLGRALAGPLNLVNALVVASERGITVSRSRRAPEAGHDTLVELAATDAPAHSVAGALLGGEHARLVTVDAFRVDVAPRGSLLLIRNDDVPGVIGQVGSRLGDEGVNIAEFHQSRRRAGEEALAVVALDQPLGAATLAAIRSLPSVREARQVVFDR